MKKWLFLSCWLMAALSMAIPAKRVKRTITLPDGTQKEVALRGDEHVHFYVDSDDNAYRQDEIGQFVQVDKSLLLQRWQNKLDERNSLRARRAARRAKWGATSNSISGSKKGIVILVNFSDKDMVSTHSNSYFNDYFNLEGFNKDNMRGSVHDYFKECSYGKFDLTFDVFGPVTVSKTLAYYGENDQDGNDKHAAEMVIEACKLADKKGADFSKYDWDGDGYVDQVFLLYAGYGENAGAPSRTIWPHEFDLSSAKYYGDGTGTLSVDGVKVDTYAVSSELAGSYGNVVNGIGTACHEFSHCMCLPDLYDTGGGSVSNYGMDSWDLMDYGSYLGASENGECPAAFTSYERMYCGWLTPTELTSSTSIADMKNIALNPEAYIIYNEGNRNEYYLLENRQKVGFHSYSEGHGLLVLHVDFDATAWTENTVNNTSTHQRMTIVAADGKNESSNNSGDPYPGTSKNTKLTDTSSPAAKVFNRNADGRYYMGRPIENITEANSLISFDFDGGIQLPELDTPVAQAPSDLTSTSFKASWQSVQNATSYEIELTSTSVGNNIDPKSILVQESFTGFNNGLSGDGSLDISSNLDSYTKHPGWTGSKLFTTPSDEVKIGAKLTKGSLSTPLIYETDDITVVISARRYASDSDQFYFTYTQDGVTEDVSRVTLEGDEMFFALSLQGMKSPYRVGVRSDKRAYLSQFVVLKGTYTSDELKEMFRAPVRVKTIEDVRDVQQYAEATSRFGISVQSVSFNGTGTVGTDLSKDLECSTTDTAARKATQKNTFTTASTYYIFTDLSSNKSYSYRVRALADGYKPSQWSNSINVTLLPTAIRDILNDSHSSGSKDKIYDLQGRPISVTPRHGIYIVGGRKVLK